MNEATSSCHAGAFPFPSILIKLILWLAFSALMVIAAVLYLPLTLQAVLAWFLVGCIVLVRLTPRIPPQTQRIFLVLVSTFLSCRYLAFRTTDTLLFPTLADTVAVLLLYSAEAYGVLIHLLGLFVNIFPLQRPVTPVDLSRPDLPTVDIFIPTYNEPEEFVATNVRACNLLDYPPGKYRIFILDDGGTWQKRHADDSVAAAAAERRHHRLRSLAHSLGAYYLTREKNDHAKAGNLNEALARTCREMGADAGTISHAPRVQNGFGKSGGELILVLDCDHIPARDFLRNTVGPFLDDPDLFLVQTPHFFINPDPIEKNLDTSAHSPSENEMFYGAVHHGMDAWNASFFCGSAALLRRRHLAAIGGIQGETVTEDAETALALHAKGLRSAFISKPMACGLSPETFADFILQRSRWTQGMIQLLMRKNPLVIKGLQPYQRLCYLNACLFWLFGVARFVFWSAPLLFLFFGLQVYNASLTQIAVYALPHLAGALLVSDYMFGDVRHPFFSELFETVQSLFLVPAVFSAVLNPKSSTFQVTPKGTNLTHDALSPLAIPLYIMFVSALLSYPFAFWRWSVAPLQQDAVVLCTLWTTFNLIMTLLGLGVVWEKRQIRGWHRLRVNEDVMIEDPASRMQQKGTVLDVSLTGVRIRVPSGFTIPREKRLTLVATDSQGHTYHLCIDTIRVEQDAGHKVIGGKFVAESSEAKSQVVGYVFGDSDRWEKYWGRRRSRIGFFRSIWYLFGKGILGTIQNFSGLSRLAARVLSTLLVDGFRLFIHRKSEG